MTTQIEYDEELMNKVTLASGAASVNETIDIALRFYRQMHAQRLLSELFGKVEFYPDYDYKAMRSGADGPPTEEPCS